MKKIFTLFLALVVGCGIASASDTSIGGIWYIFNSSKQTATVTYRGSASYTYSNEYSGSVVIPNSVIYSGKTYKVTSIGDYAFSGCSALTSIEIPNGITSIGESAFYGCTGLTSIEIPNNVTNIGENAFFGCNELSSVRITDIASWCKINFENSYANPLLFGLNLYLNDELVSDIVLTSSDITSIGNYVFFNCINLTSIIIPNSVTSIGPLAFVNCFSLTSVTIPNNVKYIGDFAFRNCTSLTNVIVPNSVTSIGDDAFLNVPNVVYNGSATGSPWGAKSRNGYVEGYLVYDDVAKKRIMACSTAINGSVTIPNSVTRIDNYAFSGCSGLTTVTINSDSIVSKAYTSDSSLKDIFGQQVTQYIIGDGVESIGDYAFQNCTSLTSIEIPNSVTSIGNRAFSDCSNLNSIEIPNSVRYIGEMAFSNCNNLTSSVYNAYVFAFMPTSYSGAYSIPNGIVSISGGAFYGCSNLTAITIPNSVKSIGTYAFHGCSINEIHYIGNVQDLFDHSWKVSGISGNYVLYINNKIFTNLVIPNSIISIKSIFSGCNSLTSVTIPNNVKYIDNYAFRNCTGLVSINIPNSVKSIGNNAFYGCSGLTSAIIGNSVVSIGDYAFQNCTSLTSIEIPNSVTSIGNRAFSDCSSLNSAIIGNSVVSIGDYAFQNCTSLTSIEIPNSVTSIGNYAFRTCSKLTTVTINSNSILRKAYTYDTSLKTIFGQQVTQYVIGDGVESIGDYAFYSCSTLVSVEIPNSVTSIGERAFSGCSALTALTIPNSVTSIGNSAFSGCSKWTTVTINSNSIVSKAYTSDSSLKNVFGSQVKQYVIGDGVESIGDYAFNGCSTLVSVELPNSVTSIGESAFSGCSALTKLTIPNKITSIGNGAFQDCSNLTSIDIPASIQRIGEFAFYYCSGLNTAKINAKNPPTLGNYAFTACPADIYVPCNSLNAYQNAGYWASYASQMQCFIIYYTLTISAGEGGSVNSSINGTYDEGTELQLIATPHEGYRFIRWSDNSSINPRRITLTKDTTLTALFELIPQYSITLSASEGGSVNSSINGTYDEGTELQLIAIPNEGYRFIRWSDNSSINPRRITLTKDTTLTALFELIPQYSITLSSGEGGSVNTSINGTYDEGTALQLIATPNEGFRFIRWSDDNKDNPRTLKITKNTTLVAFFTKSSGQCGDNLALQWNYDAEVKSLTISGNGSLNSNYTYYDDVKDDITSLVIEDGVTSIGDFAFFNYPSLEYVTVGKNITSIGNNVFEKCSQLQSIKLNPTTPPEVGNDICDGETNISVPCGSYDAYNAEWSMYTSQIHERLCGECGDDLALQWEYDNVNNILTISGNGSLNSNYTYSEVKYEITRLVIEEGVTSIGKYAFEDCYRLTSIQIPNSVTSFEYRGFYGCEDLTSITVKSGNSIYDSRENCNAIIETATNVLIKGCRNTLIPHTIVGIGAEAFARSLRYHDNIIIPDNVVSIGESAFRQCYDLSIVFKSATPPSISYDVFEYNAYIYVPCGSYEAYRTEWYNYTSQIQETTCGQCGDDYALQWEYDEVNKVLTISGNGSLNKNYTYNEVKSEMTKLVIEDGVTSIGRNAFSSCNLLTSVEIPNSVTSIGDYGFNGCSALTSIDIPNSVTSIGDYVFNGCSALTSITIPNSVTSIGNSAFSGCSIKEIHYGGTIQDWFDKSWTVNQLSSGYALYINDELLTDIVIPNSVTSIGDYAFYRCTGLTSIDIPNSVTSIGSYAFAFCSGLTSVTIGNSVTSIGYGAFSSCGNLTTITISAETPPSLGYNVFMYCPANIYVPYGSIDKYKLNWSSYASRIHTLSIYGQCGENLALQWVYDKEAKVLTISGNGSLYNNYTYSEVKSEMTKLIIKEGVTSIGQKAFEKCSNLTSVTIPNSVNDIGSDAFKWCSSLPIINNIRYADTYLIEAVDNSMSSYTIKNGTRWIGCYAFRNCTGLTSIEIPNSVTSIGNGAFIGCSSLTSVTIPNSVTSIGGAAFGYCSGLTSVTIPNSVTSIGYGAFEGCSSLTSVTIPNSVTSIGSEAFYNCSALTAVTINAETPPSLGETNVFGNSVSIYVPCTAYNAYRAADNWSTYNEQLLPQATHFLTVTPADFGQVETNYLSCDEIILTVTPNDGYRFVRWSDENTDNPRTITLTKDTTLTAIFNLSGTCGEDLALKWNYDTETKALTISGNGSLNKKYTYNEVKSEMTKLVIEDGVTSIGSYAFYECSGLTSIKLSSSVTSIGNYAFAGCTDLTSVTIGNSVTSIGDGVFDGCSSLTSVEIPNSVISIGDYVFNGCDNLVAIDVDENNPNYCSLDGILFIKDKTTLIRYPCGKQGNYIIPNSVTSVGDYAFAGCSYLASIEIPNSVTSIGYSAFYGCNSLPVIDNIRYADTYLVEAVDKTLSTYSIKEGTKWIGSEAFSRSSLTSIEIPNSVISIGDYAFSYCSSLTSIEIPNSVTSIGNSAFSRCSSLTSIEIPNSVTSMGSGVFSSCTELTSVIIPNSITSIENSTFSNCRGLTSIEIPNSVTSIGNSAFSRCSSLTSIEIPNKVTSIGNNAFSNCTGLASITCQAENVPSLGYDVFYGVEKSIPIYVPVSSVALYADADQWKDFNIYAIPETPTEIDEVSSDNSSTTKVEKLFRNNQILILRGDKTYTVTGQEVR